MTAFTHASGERPDGGRASADYNPVMYELLNAINDPAELRTLDRRELKQLADELRAFVLESVAQTGGHLSSNLGTVELTIASSGTSATRPTRTRFSPGGARG